jgi:hypothetical protein
LILPKGLNIMIKFYIPRDRETNKLSAPKLSFSKTQLDQDNDSLGTVYELWIGWIVVCVMV